MIVDIVLWQTGYQYMPFHRISCAIRLRPISIDCISTSFSTEYHASIYLTQCIAFIDWWPTPVGDPAPALSLTGMTQGSSWCQCAVKISCQGAGLPAWPGTILTKITGITAFHYIRRAASHDLIIIIILPKISIGINHNLITISKIMCHDFQLIYILFILKASPPTQIRPSSTYHIALIVLIIWGTSGIHASTAKRPAWLVFDDMGDRHCWYWNTNCHPDLLLHCADCDHDRDYQILLI